MDKQEQQQQEIQQNQDQISDSSSDLAQDSSYQQRPAFFIPQDIDNADPEQLAAFDYLMDVRKQAKHIKDQDKRKKKSNKRESIHNIGSPSKQNLITDPSNKMNDKNLEQLWFSNWKKEIINNWKCVVENVKYLQKNNKKNTQERGIIGMWKKPSKQILSEKPKILELSKIQLGRIEQLISDLSEEYFTGRGKNYYVWIYSLLAIHRSLASYCIFEALASINSCILQQNRVTVQTLIVTCILSKQFMQVGLEKLEPKLIGLIEEVN